jgi:putative membrane-bound dehydrogenase-like protein
MTDKNPESLHTSKASDDPVFLGQKLRENRLFMFVGLSALAFFVVLGCFFVGRRIYYRMIQPAPLWTVATPKEERIVCDPSLSIHLWADETLVHNPTSLSVDARGRVWVSEAVNYRDWQNQQRETGQPYEDAGDCIVILEDTDADGRADSRTVFAQDRDLVSPTGVCVLGNRVFVSCSPSIFVYIDDDGDDRADRKEVLLTGFGGHDHDHGVHSVVPGPDGRLYFAVGNAGPHVVTDKDGWTLRAGSLLQWIPKSFETDVEQSAQFALNTGGLVSDDGRVYAGGLVLSVEPDGSDLQVHSHNARNSYEICVDSCGDVWQTDNDDTASCRMTWLMKGASTGFTSADGRRSWQADQRPGQATEVAHWHQDDPGVLPAGDIYGTGAPTGLVRYEGHELGPALQGAILACDAGLGCVFAFQPVAQGAGFSFQRTKIVWSELLSDANLQRPDGLALTWFRPTDVAIASNGDVFVSDWYDSYVGAHRVNDFAADGRIYVVRPRSSAELPRPALGEVAEQSHDAAFEEHEVADLRSYVPEIRWMARQDLLENPETALTVLEEFLNSPDLFLQSRALFVLSNLGDLGKAQVRSQLSASDSQVRIAAFRSLSGATDSAVSLATSVVNDPAPAVRREASIALRGLSLDDSRSLLIQLAAQIDGEDRFAIEAFGLACEGVEEFIYPELRLRMGADVAEWSPAFSLLAWRLHPFCSLEDLHERLHNKSLSSLEKRRMIDAVAFVPHPRAAEILAELAGVIAPAEPGDMNQDEGLLKYAAWWRNRLQEKHDQLPGTTALTATRLRVRYAPAVQRPVDSQRVERIATMAGNAEQGQELFHSKQGTCGNCHRLHERGGDAGPNLSQISVRLTRRQLVEAILYPSNSILTGYESWSVIDKQGRVFSGLLEAVSENITLKNAEAKRITIAQTEIEELVRQGASLMPEELSKSLSDQQIADLVTFLSKSYP